MKTIAETAWHHQGDFNFMVNLIENLCINTKADIIKMHISLDLDEYIDVSHPAYTTLKEWVFNEDQWKKIISIVKSHNKQVMLLVNDFQAIELAKELNPEYVEIHSVCLNDLFLLEKLKTILNGDTKLVLGVGGTDVYEIEHALSYLAYSNVLLMFGFQNYPTVYSDVNLNKVRRIMKLFEGYEFGYADHTAWDNDNNELVTLLGAASGMDYIEKHVTTHYGEERADWHAAISIEMFNSLSDKLKVLHNLNGDGLLKLNSGELNYSVFGPMKKAAVLVKDVQEGEVLTKDVIKFIRTGEITDLSQLDVINSLGKKFLEPLKSGSILKKNFIG